MNKRDIVVVPNEAIVLIPDGSYHESSDSKQHGELFYDFCSKFKIRVDFDKCELGQICAYELAMMGHLAIIIENNFAVLFIPAEVSNNQLKWVNDHYSILNRYDVHGLIHDEKQIRKIEKDEEIINPLKEIYNIMKKRNKTKKEGVNRCIKN